MWAIFRSWPPTELSTFSSPGFVPKVLEGVEESTREYVVYVPEEYDDTRPLPLVVFLHGIGGIGSDGRQQLKIGLAPEVKDRHQTAQAISFFVLFPQTRQPWFNESTDHHAVIRMLDKTETEYMIDTDRIYLTGILDGSTGVFKLAAEYPGRWAALVPISSERTVGIADQIKSLPSRWYHNSQDKIQSVRQAVSDLLTIGAPAELIEFDEFGRDAWTRAYSDPGLYEWLKNQVRSPVVSKNSDDDKAL